MEAKITFSELVSKVANRQLEKNALDTYFALDAASSRTFSPRFGINTAAVDVAGVEAAAQAAGHALALDAESGTQQNRLQPFMLRGGHAQTLAEGDSWFSHPLVKTCIVVLQDVGYEIENLATAGHTLGQMLAQRQYAPFLRSGRFTHFLFSGGGNDVLGDLRSLINTINFSYTDANNPAHVAYYVRPEFRDVLSALRASYATLIGDVRTLSPGTRLMLNGYAYARPVANGPALGDDFEFLGFQLAHRPEHLQLAWAIVRSMVDRFNVILKNLASNASDVGYYDLRPVVLQNQGADWYDAELHPSRRAARKIAALLAPDLPQQRAAQKPAPAKAAGRRGAAAGTPSRPRARR